MQLPRAVSRPGDVYRPEFEGDALVQLNGLPKAAFDALSKLASHVARAGADRTPARDGLELAYRAADEARYEPMPRLNALVAIRHAEAASLLGDKTAFRSAITRARRELDRGPRASEPGWMRYVDETEITGVEAKGYWGLGEMDSAEKLYRGVLDRELKPLVRAFHGADLSRMLLGWGAREDAITEAVAVLSELENGVTSTRSLAELRPVRIAARRADNEEFCTRYDAVERKLKSLHPVPASQTALLN